MPKKFIAPTILLVAGIMMAVFLVRLGGGADKLDLAQIFLFYGALTVADGALVTHTVLYRRENLSKTNFGLKLGVGILIFLLIITFMIGDIFFA